jgi:PAS domain S-box-containing protein
MRAHKPTELDRIREILAAHPKGLTIEEISQMLPLNRNSTAKYLNTLHISGQVELREFGRAKVFSLTERVPLSQMLSLSRDLILVLDNDRFILHTNDSLLDFFGMDRQDLIGHRIEYTPLAGSFPESIKTRLQEAAAGSKSNQEVCIVRDGEENYFQLSMVPIVFDSGSSGISLCFEDITDLRNYQIYLEHLVEERTEKLDLSNQRLKQKIEELKSVKNDLETSEKRFRLLAKNARDIIYRIITGPDPWYEYVSPAIETITGYSYDSFIADPRFAFSIVHPGDRGILADILAGKAFSEEVRIRWLHKNGSVIWMGEKNTPVYDENGTVIMIEGIARDISERMQVEEELAASNAYNRGLIETSLDPMIAIDQAGIIRDANRAMEIITGVERTGVIGSLASSWFVQHTEVEGALRQAEDTGSVRNVSLSLLGRNGTRVPVLLTAGAFDNGQKGRHHVLATVRDITDLTECENALSRAEAGYRTLLAMSPNGVFLTNLGGSVLLVNRRAVIMTGYLDDGSLMGKDISAIIPEVPLLDSLLERVKNGERVQIPMTPIITADGGRTCADVTIGMVPSRSEEPSALLFLLIDPVARPVGVREHGVKPGPVGYHEVATDPLCNGVQAPNIRGFSDRSSFTRP